MSLSNLLASVPVVGSNVTELTLESDAGVEETGFAVASITVTSVVVVEVRASSGGAAASVAAEALTSPASEAQCGSRHPLTAAALGLVAELSPKPGSLRHRSP